MSYLTLKNMCSNSDTCMTNNEKYTDPFLPDSNKILALYDDNNIRLNSYKFNHNNLYPFNKTYDYVGTSYEHYVSKLFRKRDRILQDEIVQAEEIEMSKENSEQLEKSIKQNIYK